MQIEVDHYGKTVCFWLTKAETEDADVSKTLKPAFDKCRKHKYRAVVFKSGTDSLVEVTSALLHRNRYT